MFVVLLIITGIITIKYKLSNASILNLQQANTSAIEQVANEEIKENKEEEDTSENIVVEVEPKTETKKANMINGIEFCVTPVEGKISSRYGSKENIRSKTHKGLDIAASKGTAIIAAAEGTVTFAGYNNGGYGYLVIISHGNGVESYYGHCSKINVKKGENIKAGQKIAEVGSTGRSTGNHLHFELRVDGEQVNPQKYLYSE